MLKLASQSSVNGWQRTSKYGETILDYHSCCELSCSTNQCMMMFINPVRGLGRA